MFDLSTVSRWLASGSKSSEPWVTRLAIVACIGVFIALAALNDYENWDTLASFGYLPPESIWRGRLWSLITSTFVHFELWHVAFNVYWLWMLGRRMELAVGSFAYLLFFLSAAFVSSTLQLAASDTTGIGASGVGYAIFGFLWAARDRDPSFREILTDRLVKLFLIWLVGCIVVTELGILEIGNMAHVAGLIFGLLAAHASYASRYQATARGGVAVLVAASVLVLVWCPWSVTWLVIRAYDAHEAGRYEEAVSYYSKILDIAPEHSWALLNRSYAYSSLDRNELAEADRGAVRRIDPTIDEADRLRGEAYQIHAENRLEDAVLLYSRLLVLNPADAWALLNRSYAYQALGKNDLAKADREAALSIDPQIENSRSPDACQ